MEANYILVSTFLGVPSKPLRHGDTVDGSEIPHHLGSE